MKVEWCEIKAEEHQKLIESMSRRSEGVIKAKAIQSIKFVVYLYKTIGKKKTIPMNDYYRIFSHQISNELCDV